ncbi:unnamed protein product, partial [Adineta steineri]
MSVARYWHTASTLANGSVLVAGGYNSHSDHLNSADLYNPSTGTWTATGNMSVGRQHHTASTLANGLILVTAGIRVSSLNSAELYNPSTGAWEITGNM